MEYEKWAINKVKPIQAEPYIPTVGGRKLPYTMENVMKILTKRGVKGTELSGGIHGIEFARAKGAKQFKSLAHIQKEQGSLLDHREFEQRKNQLGKKFDDLSTRLGKYYTGGHSGFHMMDSLVEAIGESYKKGHSLRSELHLSQFKDVPQHLVDELAEYARDLVNMGTEYFEAKPQRVVGIHEFKGAAVPHDAKQDILDLLNQYGVTNIERYDRNKPGDRLRATNAVADRADLKLSEADLAFGKLVK